MAKKRLTDAEIRRRYQPHLNAFLRHRGLGHRRFSVAAINSMGLRSMEAHIQQIRRGKEEPPADAVSHSVSDLRRYYIFDQLGAHHPDDFADLYLLKEKKDKAARRKRVKVPDDVVDAHASHITTFLKLNAIEGMPFTGVAKNTLSPESIEAAVAKRMERAVMDVSIRDMRRAVIHERMEALHSMGGLVGVDMYRNRNQVPDHIKRQHQAYITACLRDMRLEGRTLRSDARSHLNPASIENEAMKIRLGVGNRRLAGLRFRGAETEMDMNQLRMNVIAKRMEQLHKEGRLVRIRR